MARRSMVDRITNNGGGNIVQAVERRSPPLSRTMAVAGHGFASGDDRTIRRTIETLTRAGVTYTGASYGFALAWDQSKSVWDKARTIDGPFARIRWVPTKFKTFKQPIYNESSRANGSRWGGLSGNIGLNETADMSKVASAPALGNLTFDMKRLTVFTPPISRDLLADSALVEDMLDYVSRSEIRFLVDQALICGNSRNTNTGATTVEAPSGILSSPAAIPVKRKTGGTLSAADIDACWNAIAGPNKRNAVWHCSDETLSVIDELAMTSGWPESLYTPGGRYANTYPLLKGRPLIYAESCSVLGTNGDLVIADWSDYVMYFQEYEPSGSSLSFTLAPPDPATQGLGAWGLPDKAIEGRRSDQFLFLNDEVVYLFKARMDGAFLWNQPTINANGAIVGPAAFVN